MKSFENVYIKLNELFIESLGDYIQKVNKEHNDGLILQEFRNRRASGKCEMYPSFLLSVEEAEYTEKDRLLENAVLCVCVEIKLQKYIENEFVIFCRYAEAIQRMIDENDGERLWQSIRITRMEKNKIYIRITI